MLVTLPLQITLPRKRTRDKQIHLSVNVWDTLHHAVKTQVKQVLSDLVIQQLQSYPVIDLGQNLCVTCNLWTRHGNLDLPNFVTVIEKRVTDNVVRLGFIQDDKVKYITQHIYNYMGIDKDNPRLEIEYASRPV